ncbi:hypothetical protein ACHAWF_013534 [Thalassiosira exigua]
MLKLLEKETSGGEASRESVESALKRIAAITCDPSDADATNLLEFLPVSEATLEALNSSERPIFKRGLYIELPPAVFAVEESTERPSKKPKVCGTDVLMGRVLIGVRYLEYS